MPRGPRSHPAPSTPSHLRAFPRARHFASAWLLLAAALPGCADFANVKPGATSIFDLFGEPTPSEAAAWAVDPYDADRRYRGTQLLSSAYFAGEPVYLELFRDNLDDPDAGVRVVATRAVANHGTPDDVAGLVVRLGDVDPLVRVEAARGLQRIHNPIAVAPLIAAIREPDFFQPDIPGEVSPDVRAEAAHALGQYPSPAVIQALIGALNDSKLAVNRNVLASLRTLTGQDFGLDQRVWLQWFRDTDNLFAAGAAYVYPNFSRDKYWFEYLPFVPPPPNEPSASPAGLTGLPAEIALQPVAAPASPAPAMSAPATPAPAVPTEAPTPAPAPNAPTTPETSSPDNPSVGQPNSQPASPSNPTP